VSVLGRRSVTSDSEAATRPAPSPCCGILVRGNRLDDCAKGIFLSGAVRDVQVIGNVLTGGGRLAAIELQNLLPGTQDVLVANNTVVDAVLGMRVWDETIHGERVALRANLFLGSQDRTDWIVVDSGGSQLNARGPGEPLLVAARWTVDRNWREAIRPTSGDPIGVLGWVPPSEADALRDEIAVLSRDATSKDFLRPAADSPLATGGVSAEGLPPFVGAVEPKGSEPWDWSRAWDERPAAGR